MMRAGLWLLLIASLAFNAGVLLTLGVRAAREVVGGQAPPPNAPHGIAPDHAGRPFDGQPFAGEPGRALRRERILLRAQIEALREELRTESEALAALIVDGQGESEAATKKLDQVMRLRREMLVAIVEHLVRIRDVVGMERPEAFKRLVQQVLARSDDMRPPPQKNSARENGRFPGRGPRFDGGRFRGKRIGPDAERRPGAFTPKSRPGRELGSENQNDENGADRDRSEHK